MVDFDPPSTSVNICYTSTFRLWLVSLTIQFKQNHILQPVIWNEVTLVPLISPKLIIMALVALQKYFGNPTDHVDLC